MKTPVITARSCWLRPLALQTLRTADGRRQIAMDGDIWIRTGNALQEAAGGAKTDCSIWLSMSFGASEPHMDLNCTSWPHIRISALSVIWSHCGKHPEIWSDIAPKKPTDGDHASLSCKHAIVIKSYTRPQHGSLGLGSSQHVAAISWS